MKPVMNRVYLHSIPFSAGDRLISLIRGSDAVFRGVRTCNSTCTCCMSNYFLMIIDEVGHAPGGEFCYGHTNEIFWQKKEVD